MELLIFYYAIAGLWVFSATLIRFVEVVHPTPFRLIDYLVYCLLLWPHLVYRILQKQFGA